MPILLVTEFLKNNWKLIAEIAGCLVIAILCWWFFMHNPKVIKELENDKAELGRMLEAKNDQIKLYANIEKGKGVINAGVQAQISSLRATARPRRTVIIHGGRMLQTMPVAVKAAH